MTARPIETETMMCETCGEERLFRSTDTGFRCISCDTDRTCVCGRAELRLLTIQRGRDWSQVAPDAPCCRFVNVDRAE